MNPVFRELEFIEDVTLRAEYRSRAEEFARKLSRKFQMKNQLPHRSESPINIECDKGLEPSSNGSSTVSRVRNRMVPFPNQVRGKKRSFDLMECADSAPVDRRSLDEVCLYNLVQVGTIPGTRRKFIKDDYAEMNFWYGLKTELPTLFAVAARTSATPVSSAASQRVLSALKLVVHDESSRLTNKTILRHNTNLLVV